VLVSMTIKRQMLPRDFAVKRPLLALFGHSKCTDECPLSGIKRT
jgi:hypothetical protein